MALEFDNFKIIFVLLGKIIAFYVQITIIENWVLSLKRYRDGAEIDW